MLVVGSPQTWMWFAPIGSVAFPVMTIFCIRLSKDLMEFVSSSLTSASIILTAGFTMFPFIVPSSFNTNHSLTLWDATSSELTLNIIRALPLLWFQSFLVTPHLVIAPCAAGSITNMLNETVIHSIRTHYVVLCLDFGSDVGVCFHSFKSSWTRKADRKQE